MIVLNAISEDAGITRATISMGSCTVWTLTMIDTVEGKEHRRRRGSDSGRDEGRRDGYSSLYGGTTTVLGV